MLEPLVDFLQDGGEQSSTLIAGEVGAAFGPFRRSSRRQLCDRGWPHAGVGRIALEVRDQAPAQHIEAALPGLGIVPHHGRRLADGKFQSGWTLGTALRVPNTFARSAGVRYRAKRPHRA